MPIADITVRSTAPYSFTTVASTSLVVTMPTGLVNGDVIVVWLTSNNGSWNSLTGWVSTGALFGSTSPGNPRSFAAYHIVTNAGTEPATYTFTMTTAQTATAKARAYVGVDTTNVLDGGVASTFFNATTTTTSFPVPAYTTVTNKAMLIGGASGNSGGATISFTEDSPDMVRAWDTAVDGTTGTKSNTYADGIKATAGSTGVVTWTANTGRAGHAWVAALRPIVTTDTVPGAPTAVTALGGTTKARVSFTAPASNGGQAITGYTVTASTGQTAGPFASSPIEVTGLTDGTPVTFTVTATNSVGTGAASAASNSVTPNKQAPIVTDAAVADQGSPVSWAAPVNSYGIVEVQVEGAP